MKYKKNAFTLIEVLIYIAIGIVIVPAIVALGLNLLAARARAKTQQELAESLRLASERISFEIRNATAINSVSSSSISLNASESARTPLVIDLNSDRIRLGAGTSGDCSSSSPCPLTSNLIQVTGLTFTDLSSGASKHIRFKITAALTSGRAEYQYNLTATGSAELRSN